MKSLVLWAEGPVELARRRHAEGATLVAWSDTAADALATAEVPFTREALDFDAQDAVDEAAIAWTKLWGARPLLDGRSFRELLAWKGEPLWYFAELYLHYSTRATAYVRLIERFSRLIERERPDEVEAVGLPREQALLLGRTATARGVLAHATPERAALALRARCLGVSLESRWNSLKTWAAALKAGLAGAPPAPTPDGRRLVLFLSHAAFWRERADAAGGEPYEHYLDRLIPGVAADPALQPAVVAVGPRAAFRRRGARERLGDWLRLGPGSGPYVHVNAFTSWRVLRETRAATRLARDAWRRLRGLPGMREAFTHRGVPFSDLAEPDLAATLLLQLPWAVRSREEMAEALARLRPALVCLYAESSGWGRAALSACRAAGVPSLAIQHGILYPKYYSYLHTAEEADCPRPDRTALFGEAARELLVERGGYAPGSLELTGSPRFDQLLETARGWDRATLRRGFAVEEQEKLVVVASRYRGIRESYQSIGSAFPALVQAIEALPGVRCLVKPHPAESQLPYSADLAAARATRTRVLPPGADLPQLMHAADALVTVESLSAVEALVLSRPVLILNMPTNLRELVERGAALGVACGADPTSALRALLFDPETAERLTRARAEYLRHVACGVDGAATVRILDLLRKTAGGAGVVGS